MGRPRKKDVSSQVIERGKIAPLKKPHGLGAAESYVWDQLMRSVSVDHFRELDTPLLTLYCKAVIQGLRAYQEVEGDPLVEISENGTTRVNPKIKAVEAYTRMVSTLSQRLRIAPSSRFLSVDKRVTSVPASVKVSDGDEVDELFYQG